MKKTMTMLVLLCAAAFAQQKGSFTDTRDKKTYKTVKIGEQTWMAENLNYDAKGSKCYDNKPANCQKYGRLYDWNTALKACPSGWHLPSDEEWQTLLDFADGDYNVAEKKLKAKSGWNNDFPCGDGMTCKPVSGNGTDVYGFSALPGGRGSSNGGFYIHSAGDYGIWWSATEEDASNAWYRLMLKGGVDAARYYDDKTDLYSVRCVQDSKLDGEQKTFDKDGKLQDGNVATAGSFTDTRDKKTYKTVKIGEQTWMAENLNHNANGSKCYDNQESNCQKYGRLYDWDTALKACPNGWHLPSDAEWQTLVDFAGGDKVAGTKLKAKSGWDKNGNGTDALGFSALPGGNGYSNGDFDDVGRYGDWWSATESSADDAWYRDMDYHLADVLKDYDDKTYLCSVRCVQD